MDINITYYWKNWDGELEIVETEYVSKDRTIAFVKRFDGCTIAVPIKELIVVTDIEKYIN